MKDLIEMLDRADKLDSTVTRNLFEAFNKIGTFRIKYVPEADDDWFEEHGYSDEEIDNMISQHKFPENLYKNGKVLITKSEDGYEVSWTSDSSDYIECSSIQECKDAVKRYGMMLDLVWIDDPLQKAARDAGAEDSSTEQVGKSEFELSEDGKKLLKYNGNATEVTIPEGITNIGKEAFCGGSCNKIRSITLPSSVNHVGKDAFRDCTAIDSVNITDLKAWCKISFTNSFANPLCHAKNLYLNNELVTDLVIPEGVTCIHSYAFESYTSLQSVAFPNSVTRIGERAFGNCKGLTEITIPNGVKSIGSFAFNNCTGLQSATLGNKVTKIGNGSFWGCENLTSINIPDNANIENGVFSGCNNLTYNTYDNGKYLGNSNNPYHILLGTVSKDITTCTIHEDTKIIGYEAFRNCTNLTSISIPDRVTSIGKDAFWKCTSLTSVTIGNGVTSIGSHAFGWCTNLANVTLGNRVTSIGSDAFGFCKSLKSITIPDSVTSMCTFAGVAPETTVFVCHEGSYAHKYATKYDIPFKLIESLNRAHELDEGRPSKELVNKIASTTQYIQEFYDNCKTHFEEFGGIRALGIEEMVKYYLNHSEPIMIQFVTNFGDVRKVADVMKSYIQSSNYDARITSAKNMYHTYKRGSGVRTKPTLTIEFLTS